MFLFRGTSLFRNQIHVLLSGISLSNGCSFHACLGSTLQVTHRGSSGVVSVDSTDPFSAPHTSMLNQNSFWPERNFRRLTALSRHLINIIVRELSSASAGCNIAFEISPPERGCGRRGWCVMNSISGDLTTARCAVFMLLGL